MTPAAPMPLKDTAVTYILWFFLGIFGVHQFYMGKVGRGLLYLFTGALLSIMWWIDLFTIPSQVRAVNARRAVGIR